MPVKINAATKKALVKLPAAASTTKTGSQMSDKGRERTVLLEAESINHPPNTKRVLSNPKIQNPYSERCTYHKTIRFKITA